jgi:hypothetical protein
VLVGGGCASVAFPGADHESPGEDGSRWFRRRCARSERSSRSIPKTTPTRERKARCRRPSLPPASATHRATSASRCRLAARADDPMGRAGSERVSGVGPQHARPLPDPSDSPQRDDQGREVPAIIQSFSASSSRSRVPVGRTLKTSSCPGYPAKASPSKPSTAPAS